MRYRHTEIMANQDLGAAGVKIIDINIVDPVSRITVLFRPVGGSDTAVAHPVSGISKIELIDGSDVLYSLSGYEGHALNVFEAKSPLITRLDYRDGGTPYIVVNLDFGRYLWDPDFVFDPKKFTNPQLKITWDEDAWDASCDSHGFMVYAHVFDEAEITPVGFLMSKQIKSYVGTAGGYEYTDLPLDYPLRKLIVQGWEKEHTIRSIVEDIRLSEDNDKRIPIDGDIYDLRSFLNMMAGECVDEITMKAKITGNRAYCTPGQFYNVQLIGQVNNYVITATGIAGNTFVAKAETGTTLVRGLIRGKDPHNCVAIPFGKQDIPDDWYDITKLGSLRLRLNGGTRAANGTTNIVTQQARKY